MTGRNLKGGASKYSAVGRERCAYFFWQGQDSNISAQVGILLTGRNLKGGASKYSAVGRERCTYFFWQGQDSNISAKVGI